MYTKMDNRIVKKSVTEIFVTMDGKFGMLEKYPKKVGHISVPMVKS